MTKTAQSEYSRLQSENAELLKLIAAELGKDTEGKIHYGHVGSLEYAKEKMVEIVSYLRSTDDEDAMHAQIEKEISK